MKKWKLWILKKLFKGTLKVNESAYITTDSVEKVTFINCEVQINSHVLSHCAFYTCRVNPELGKKPTITKEDMTYLKNM